MQLILRDSGYDAFLLRPQNKTVIFDEVEGPWKSFSLKQLVHKCTYPWNTDIFEGYVHKLLNSLDLRKKNFGLKVCSTNKSKIYNWHINI